MNTALLILVYILTPAAILWLTSKVTLLRKIGPVLLLYLVGIIIGNTGAVPEGANSIQDLLVTIIIPLAIPLMLFSCDFKRWDIKNAILTLITGTFAVITSVLAGYFIFKPLISLDPDMGSQMDKIAGMLVGVYTGGTPNLAAIKIMLGVPNETYILIHSYDMAVSLIYLTFVLSFGIPLFRKILRYPAGRISSEYHLPVEGYDETPYREFFKKRSILQLLAAIGLSVLIFGIAGGMSLILPDSIQMVVVILSITTLGIIASFFRRVREIKTSYNAGMYLVYIFSIVVASMADLSKLNLSGGIYLLLYITFAIFFSLAVQLMLSKLFKLDADTVLISSVSLINSPPFVPLVAAAMKNRDVIITGLTVGLVGYAIGNYLGYLISLILV